MRSRRFLFYKEFKYGFDALCHIEKAEIGGVAIIYKSVVINLFGDKFASVDEKDVIIALAYRFGIVLFNKVVALML